MALADASSITLSDYALFSNMPLIQKISYSLLMNGTVLEDLNIKTYKSMVANGSRFLGSSGSAVVGYRSLNETPSVTKSQPTPYAEAAYIISNNFDIDNIILQDVNSIQDPFTTQLQAYLKWLAYDVNDKFINNDHVTGNAKAFVGIRFRLDNPTQFNIPTEMKFAAGGSTVDISAGANGDGILESIQQLLDIMSAPDGNDIVLYMNELTRRKLDRAVKKLGTTGGFNMITDQFNRRVTYYNGAKVRTIGRKADQATQIIPSVETAVGAQTGGNYSSIYGVRHSPDTFSAWQFRSMEEAITGPYMLTSSGVQQRITFDYPIGLWQEDVRSVGRIFGIKTS